MTENGKPDGPRAQGNGQGELLTFPCRIDIKAVGRHSTRFNALVHSIVSRHVETSKLVATRSRLSSGGKYLAVTLTIEAASRAQLDDIYRDLSGCDEVLVAL